HPVDQATDPTRPEPRTPPKRALRLLTPQEASTSSTHGSQADRACPRTLVEPVESTHLQGFRWIDGVQLNQRRHLDERVEGDRR
ncbi:MAG: hypothetical protein ACTH2Q_05110, partial [Propionibacteriaceae bacterium]